MSGEGQASENRIRVDADELRAFATDVLAKLGVPPEDAAMAADVLVYADLRGVETHGMSNNNLGRIYVRDIQSGKIKPDAPLEVVRETPVTALLDANLGLGAIGGGAGDEHGNREGAGVVHRHGGGEEQPSLRGGAVFFDDGGAARDDRDFEHEQQPNRAADGGRQPVYGTNPISVGAPSGSEPDFCLDVGTSAMVFQKLILTTRLGAEIPLGVAADDEGVPTSSATEAVEARKLLPLGSTPELGSHKGYGLGMLVDVLCGILSGHGASIQLDAHESYGSVGHFFCAIRVDAFRPLEEFRGQMDDMFDRVHRTEPVAGVERVLVAGDPEAAKEEERRRLGVPLLPAVVEELRELGEDVGVRWGLTG